jgi:hypothetical protein
MSGVIPLSIGSSPSCAALAVEHGEPRAYLSQGSPATHSVRSGGATSSAPVAFSQSCSKPVSQEGVAAKGRTDALQHRTFLGRLGESRYPVSYRTTTNRTPEAPTLRLDTGLEDVELREDLEAGLNRLAALNRW